MKKGFNCRQVAVVLAAARLRADEHAEYNFERGLYFCLVVYHIS